MSWGVRYGTAGLVGFVILTAVNVLSVTMLIWLAANGRSVLLVLPFSVGAWGCYLCSHYLVEGRFVDESGSPREAEPGLVESLSGQVEELSSSPTRGALAAGGVGSMVLTFPTGIVAVGSDDFTLLLVSAVLFVGGYIVGHQGLTGKPL